MLLYGWRWCNMNVKKYEELICKLALFGADVEQIEHGISQLADWLSVLLDDGNLELNDYLTLYRPAFDSYENTSYVVSRFLTNYNCGAYKEYGKVTVPKNIFDIAYHIGNALGEFVSDNVRYNKDRNMAATKAGIESKILSLI